MLSILLFKKYQIVAIWTYQYLDALQYMQIADLNPCKLEGTRQSSNPRRITVPNPNPITSTLTLTFDLSMPKPSQF